MFFIIISKSYKENFLNFQAEIEIISFEFDKFSGDRKRYTSSWFRLLLPKRN